VKNDTALYIIRLHVLSMCILLVYNTCMFVTVCYVAVACTVDAPVYELSVGAANAAGR